MWSVINKGLFKLSLLTLLKYTTYLYHFKTEISQALSKMHVHIIEQIV
jgi:hypothetical protein